MTLTVTARLFVGGLATLLWWTVQTPLIAAETPLSDAAMEGDLEQVRQLIAEDAELNVAQGDGMTALHWAAFHNDLELADALLEADADVGVTTRVGALTPLWFAATNGSACLLYTSDAADE